MTSGGADPSSLLTNVTATGPVASFTEYRHTGLSAPTGDPRFAAPAGARQALAWLAPGGPRRIFGTYSSSWMRLSNVRLPIISRATSG